MRFHLSPLLVGLGSSLLLTACGENPVATTSGDPTIALIIVSGNNQSGVVGRELPLPLVVKATNASGSVIANLTVDFKVTSGNGSMYVVATSTNSNGVARNYWTLGTVAGAAQTIQVRAILSNGTKQVLGTFSATALADAATQIAIQAGGGQSGFPGATVPIAPAVLVRDQFGNPVPNLPVQFAVTSGGGSLTGASALTTTAGIATVGSWTLGPALGQNTLSATATGTGIAGNPVTFAATATSPQNTALDFLQSYINVPDNPALDLTSTWTLEAWVYPRAAGNGADQDIISKWGGNPGASYILQINGTGVIRLVTSNGTTNSIVLGATHLANNSWQHVAATFAQGTLQLYLNGVLDQTATGVMVPYVGTEPVAFGREGNFAGGTLNGLIDEVRLWNVTRSAAEIATFMGQKLGGSEPGLAGYWRFDEGSGQVTLDATGQGNDGRLGTSTSADAWDPLWSSNAPVIQ